MTLVIVSFRSGKTHEVWHACRPGMQQQQMLSSCCMRRLQQMMWHAACLQSSARCPEAQQSSS